MGLGNMIKEGKWFCAIEGIAFAERIYNFYFEEYDQIPQNKRIGDLKMSVVQYHLFFVILKGIQLNEIDSNILMQHIAV